MPRKLSRLSWGAILRGQGKVGGRLARLRHGGIIGSSADAQGGAGKQNHQDCDECYSIRISLESPIVAIEPTRLDRFSSSAVQPRLSLRCLEGLGLGYAFLSMDLHKGRNGRDVIGFG